MPSLTLRVCGCCTASERDAAIEDARTIPAKRCTHEVISVSSTRIRRNHSVNSRDRQTGEGSDSSVPARSSESSFVHQGQRCLTPPLFADPAGELGFESSL